MNTIKAINKKNTGFFSKDDEGFAELLAVLAAGVLKNSLYYDDKMSVQNYLWNLVKSAQMLMI